MLDLDQFVEDCRTALTADPTHKSVAEIVTRALSDPANVLAAVGEPTAGGIFPIHPVSLVWIDFHQVCITAGVLLT